MTAHSRQSAHVIRHITKIQTSSSLPAALHFTKQDRRAQDRKSKLPSAYCTALQNETHQTNRDISTEQPPNSQNTYASYSRAAAHTTPSRNRAAEKEKAAEADEGVKGATPPVLTEPVELLLDEEEEDGPEEEEGEEEEDDGAEEDDEARGAGAAEEEEKMGKKEEEEGEAEDDDDDGIAGRAELGSANELVRSRTVFTRCGAMVLEVRL